MNDARENAWNQCEVTLSRLYSWLASKQLAATLRRSHGRQLLRANGVIVSGTLSRFCSSSRKGKSLREGETARSRSGFSDNSRGKEVESMMSGYLYRRNESWRSNAAAHVKNGIYSRSRKALLLIQHRTTWEAWAEKARVYSIDNCLQCSEINIFELRSQCIFAHRKFYSA